MDIGVLLILIAIFLLIAFIIGQPFFAQRKPIQPESQPLLDPGDPNSIPVMNPQSRDQDETLELWIATRRGTHLSKEFGFCPHCGKPVQEDDRFCPRCGTPLNSYENQPSS